MVANPGSAERVRSCKPRPTASQEGSLCAGPVQEDLLQAMAKYGITTPNLPPPSHAPSVCESLRKLLQLSHGAAAPGLSHCTLAAATGISTTTTTTNLILKMTGQKHTFETGHCNLKKGHVRLEGARPKDGGLAGNALSTAEPAVRGAFLATALVHGSGKARPQCVIKQREGPGRWWISRCSPPTGRATGAAQELLFS